MAGLIGKKVGMTSIFNEAGKSVPVTIINAGPCVVTQVKADEKDGYNAYQLGYLDKKESRATKAELGHTKKAKTAPKQKIKEFSNFEGEYNIGDIIDVNLFEEGEYVDVVGTSKGKGFQGVVKRHGFAGVGDATHGQHNRLRAPGSIGAASYPARVFKGMKMAGRTGSDTVKVQNLKVMKILSEDNVILVSGAVPGSRGSYVYLEK